MTIRKYLNGLEEFIDRNLGLDTDIGDMLISTRIDKDGITYTLKKISSNNVYSELYDTLTKKVIKSNGFKNVKGLKEIKEDNLGEYITTIEEKENE